MAYNGRRGPNVSAYIANLNAIPTEQDLQSSNQESFIDDDLAMFTNTQFFDFDIGADPDLQAGSFAEGQSGQTVSADSIDGKGLDFMSGQCRVPLRLLCCCCCCCCCCCFHRSRHFSFSISISLSLPLSLLAQTSLSSSATPLRLCYRLGHQPESFSAPRVALRPLHVLAALRSRCSSASTASNDVPITQSQWW